MSTVPIKNKEVSRVPKYATLEDRVSAEFKHLRMRISRLEELVLSQQDDSGYIKDPVKKLRKG